jgi:hypothetical protein
MAKLQDARRVRLNRGVARTPVCLLGLAVFISCSGREFAGTPTSQPSISELSAAVLSTVPIHVDSGVGRLARIDDSVRKNSSTELSSTEARELALRWVRRFGKYQLDVLSDQAQSRLDLMSLTPCREARYARSVYEPPDRSAPRDYQIAFGSWWIVSFCRNSSVVVLIAVSSVAHRDAIPRDTTAKVAALHGSEFLWTGVPSAREPYSISSPEAAVVFAATASRAKVSAAPELLSLPAPSGGPFRAVWRLTMDREVRTRGHESGDMTLSRVLFVGGASDDRASLGMALFRPLTDTSEGRARVLPPRSNGSRVTPAFVLKREHPLLPLRLERSSAEP